MQRVWEEEGCEGAVGEREGRRECPRAGGKRCSFVV